VFPLPRTIARIKNWTPPALWAFAKAWLGPVPAFRGHYRSWADARKDSSGYNNADIAARVLAATLKVRAGEACYERDSVLFERPSPRYPLVAELLATAGEFDNKLSVLDFGGALGSLYFQHRSYLERVHDLKWGVVEQQSFLDVGCSNLTDGCLQFHESIAACASNINPGIAIASCVLQYLPDPLSALQDLLRATPKTIIDRLPLIDARVDRLTVQTVDERIYRASYPAWFFARDRFIEAISDAGYRVVTEFESIDTIELDGESLRTTGLVVRKKGPA
jgi:putative methyltransferase (TIGR04325 family)